MTSRGKPRAENPCVAPIEKVLRNAASVAAVAPTLRDGVVVTTHAVSLCACETFDEWETWVVHAVGEDGIGWLRVPPGAQVLDVVDAEDLASHHPAPEGVLAWLVGDDPDPWRAQDDPKGFAVFAEIHRRIRLARTRNVFRP
ncbi:hypothetical protein AAII07_04765 [Microvirga sp. 0TCS3.31]